MPPANIAVPARRSGGIGRRAAFRAQWAQARVGSSPTFGINTETAWGVGRGTLPCEPRIRHAPSRTTPPSPPCCVDRSQYLGTLESTFTLHPSMPPPPLPPFREP